MAPGVLLNWLPYKLPTWIADRVTRTPDEPASYKVMGALALAAYSGSETRCLTDATGYTGPWSSPSVNVGKNR